VDKVKQIGDMGQATYYKMKWLYIIISLWLVSQMFFIDKNALNVGFRPDRALFFIILALFLVHVMRKEIRISGLGGEEICMVLFALLCSVSLIQSGANADVSYGENKWANALFNITYFPFITYFITKRIKYSKQRAKIVLIVLCGVGGYLGFTGMCEHFGFEALVWPKYILDASIGTHFERVRGPFMESVAMGRILTVTLFCMLIMITEYDGIRKVVLYVFALLAAGSIYFTYTRGPWIGFGAALLAIFTLRTRMRRPGVMLLLAILIVGSTGMGSKFSFFGDDATLFSRRQNTVDDRFVSYISAFKMGTENPLFGIGFGRFEQEWDNYFTPIPGVQANPEKMSHNTFLGILAETGMISLLLYLAMLYQLSKMCFVTYRNLDTTETFERSLAAMALGLGLMYITTGFVSDLRWNLMQNNLVFLFFGIVASLAGRKHPNFSKTEYLRSPQMRIHPQG
jgi:O-antigen ligase